MYDNTLARVITCAASTNRAVPVEDDLLVMSDMTRWLVASRVLLFLSGFLVPNHRGISPLVLRPGQ